MGILFFLNFTYHFRRPITVIFSLVIYYNLYYVNSNPIERMDCSSLICSMNRILMPNTSSRYLILIDFDNLLTFVKPKNKKLKFLWYYTNLIASSSPNFTDISVIVCVSSTWIAVITPIVLLGII